MVGADISRAQVMEWLGEIADPEIPVLSIVDLGIVRDVIPGDRITVALAPTYSGCPATEVIEQSVVDGLRQQGIEDVEIRRVLSPAWTTDWITDDGRAKLRQYGVAPPQKSGVKSLAIDGDRKVACPRCDSLNTERVSEFGSTPCKAVWKCKDCLEPFEVFKCI